VARGLVADADRQLYLITDDCDVAVKEITGFYRNYDSLRYVGDALIVRLKVAPTAEQIALLNERFGHLCKSGVIHATEAFGPERKEHDRLDLHRITFVFAKHGYGDLRGMIDLCNTFVD
jgi:hypothetical protein